MATIRPNFPTTTTTTTTHRQSNLPSPSFYSGCYDDATFSHNSPFLTRPIAIPSSSSSSKTKRPTLSTPSFSSYDLFDDSDDSAVLNDSDAPSEDELPPSPSRRHSGAMSIHSNEDLLSSCYLDRAALRRETAAHRARHHHHHQQQQQQQQQRQAVTKKTCSQEAFAAHEAWDCEVDGPHMALWTPETSSATGVTALNDNDNGNKRRRRRGSMQHEDHQVSYIEGPMMCLWEP